jgi:hypothetical protein
MSTTRNEKNQIELMKICRTMICERNRGSAVCPLKRRICSKEKTEIYGIDIINRPFACPIHVLIIYNDITTAPIGSTKIAF